LKYVYPFNILTLTLLEMKNAIFCLLTLFYITTAKAQQSFFVDGTNGNDANNGTSLVTAWKTIQNAFNDATAGSIVYIKAGTYNAQLTLNVSGTSGNPIEFRNYQSDSVYIDGMGLSSNTPMINITDESNVIFRDLIVQDLIGNNAVGIQIVSSASGTVQNLTFKDIVIRNINWSNNRATKPSSSKNSQPFIAYGEGATASNPMTNIIVDSCQLYNNITGFSESLSFGGNISGITVTNNQVHDNTNIGIDFTGNYNECQCNDTAIDHARNAYVAHNICYNDVSNYATSGGIYVDGGAGILIEKNITHGNGYGIELGCEQSGMSYGLTVRDNLIYNNQIAGMAIGGYDITTTGIVISATVTNNTFVSNNYANDGTGELDITKVSNCIIKNNIFYTNGQDLLYSKEAISPQTNLLLDYNDWFTPDADSNNINMNWGNSTLTDFTTYRATSGFDKHSLFADPLLVDTSIIDPDYHLQPTSPCINNGDPSYTVGNNETDLDGNSRIINSIIDIGAYEYGSGIVPVTVTSFTAVKDQQKVLLSWSTAQELNNTYYEVQRSTDGKNFTTIGQVNGHAYTTIKQGYDFTDADPLNGISYYRLKQVDLSGLFTFTKVVSVSFNSVTTVFVNPFIVNDHILLSYNGEQTIARLFDQTGRSLKQFNINAGQNLLPVSYLPGGVYYLQLNSKVYKVLKN
jgi:hypothetical protein